VDDARLPGSAQAATLAATYGRLRNFDLQAYGAVGDGTTNDVVAINAAITAAEAAGGGKVVAPNDKTYGVLTTIAMKSNVVLDGVRLKDLTGNTSIVSLADCADATVQNCHLTGSGILGMAGRGAVWGSMGASIGPTRCKIINNTIDSVGTGGVVMDHATDCIISGNIIHRPVEHGVYISTLSTDVQIFGNQIIDAGYGGVSTVEGVKLANSVVNAHVHGNIITNALADGIVFESGVADCSAIGNTVRLCGYIGIRVNVGATDVTIDGNKVLDNVGVGIRCIGGTTIKISNNKVRANGPSCIQTDSGTTAVDISHNQLSQVGGYAIELTATGATIMGNTGDAGYCSVVRATSTGVLVAQPNGGNTNSAGAGCLSVSYTLV
jgi:hypothetical protein